MSSTEQKHRIILTVRAEIEAVDPRTNENSGVPADARAAVIAIDRPTLAEAQKSLNELLDSIRKF
jgi:hypothetical protein